MTRFSIQIPYGAVTLLLFLTLIINPLPLSAKKKKVVGQVIQVQRHVRLLRGKSRIRVGRNRKLYPRDILWTKAKSLCFIDLFIAETKLKLGPKTRLVIFEKNKWSHEIQHRLVQGNVWFHKRGSESTLRLTTPLGSLKTTEAQFFLEVTSGKVRIAVLEGFVEVHFGSSSVVLGPQSEATLVSDVPPIIRGLGEEDWVEWEEPYEEF